MKEEHIEVDMASLRFWILTTLALSTLTANAAHLQCDLMENKIVTKSFTRSISVDGVPDSFHFTENMEGSDFVASVQWDEELADLHIRKKSDEVTASGIRAWENPLIDYIGLSHGAASLNCVIDVSDGQSYRWKFFRSMIESDKNGIISVLDSFLKMANEVPTNPKEEAELNNGLCLLIGRFQNDDMWHDLSLRLLSFDAHPGVDLFPKAFDDWNLLSIKLTGMENFCMENIVADPNPIPFQDRKSLAARVPEIQQALRDTVDYLDRQFPNKPKSAAYLP